MQIVLYVYGKKKKLATQRASHVFCYNLVKQSLKSFRIIYFGLISEISNFPNINYSDRKQWKSSFF